MELSIYIKELLYSNDILIIPGIGGFKTIYRAAEINSEEHTITPPTKFLIFNKQLDSPDDFFVQQIAQQKKITKKNAEKFVKHQVDAFNKKLNKGETILLEGIGYFSKDHDIIRFDREYGSNFLTDSFGLSKIDYRSLDFLSGPNQNDEKSLKNFKKTIFKILYALGILIFAGGAIFVYINFSKIKSRYIITKTVSKITVTDKNVKVPSAVKLIPDTTKVSDLEKFFNNKTDKKNALAIDSVKVAKPSEGKSYFIIGGSFNTFKRATILANIYQKDGFKTEVLQFGEDLYRVSLGEFGDKEKALSECEKIRAMKGMEEVWLLSK